MSTSHHSNNSTSNWAKALLDCQQHAEAHALATVIATTGSTPRGSGSKMLVTLTSTTGSIGGGGLEHLVIARARDLLRSETDCHEIKQFSLGAEARQCCGGSMTVLLECFAVLQPHVVVFGAGHVCHALLQIASQLPFRLTVVDSRRALLDALPAGDNITLVHTDQVVAVSSTLAANNLLLVMTHDHHLDYALVSQLLETPCFRLLGMIGSATKANRFRQRLRNDGFTEGQLALLQSPIGLPGLQGKLPMEVAVSVVAGLMQHTQAWQQDKAAPAQSWRDMKQLLKPPMAANSGN